MLEKLMAKHPLRTWIAKYLNSYVSMVLLCFTIFCIPWFSHGIQNLLYQIFIIAIFIVITFLPDKNRNFVFIGIALAVLLKWFIAPFFENKQLTLVAEGINLLVFLYAVGQNSVDISRNKVVDQKIILDAINGYLLIGLAFGTLVAFLMGTSPDSFNFSKDTDLNMTDFNYFSFVTLSTLGYGDITPQTDKARSLAIFMGGIGQMYVAIILAMLVGKFSAVEEEED